MPSAAIKEKEKAKKLEAARTGKPSSSADNGAGESPSANDADHSAVPGVLLVLPTLLTARQRAVLHELGEAEGLQHISIGEGAARHMQFGVNGGIQVPVPAGTGGPLTDAQLCQLLQQHLQLDAAPRFAATPLPGAPTVAHPRQPGAGQHAPSRTPAGAVPSVEQFVGLQLQLLDMERQAEVAQTLEANSQLSPETAQARGRALLNLRVADMEGGLMGRTLLTLVANKGWAGGTGAAGAPELPPHKFGGHDVVAVRPNKGPGEGPPLCTGVIYRVKDNCVVVAVEEVPDDGMEQPLRLEQLANEVTYKRLKTTLTSLAKVAAGSFSAAAAAGTGKTTAVVEIVMQEVARGARVLVAAASNIAVDNLVERLVRAGPKLKVVRMGHPARLLPQVLDSSLEAHVMRSDNSSLATDCRKEIKAINAQLLKLGNWQRAERRQLRGDLRRLAKEERVRQEAAVKEVVAGAHIIAATLTGTLHHNLEGQTFDVVVIDEAAQAMEAACWAALLKAPRAVLAGDHLQLPPTVVSREAAQGGLANTLFERLQGMYGAQCSEMLTVQYRMHADIMTWSSDALYDGRVTAHASVAAHTLADLPASCQAAAPPSTAGKKKLAGAKPPAPAPGAMTAAVPVLLLIDTAGCGFEEQVEAEGDSTGNPGEAKVVMAHAQALIKAGVAAADIGIITPYNAQVALLRELRQDKQQGLEISSVDGFQGREKEAIIISMVRSNDTGEVGFLADRRRMNVAVTRARRHCAVVCDTETVSHDAFLKGLVSYFEEHGEYRSAAELVPT